MSKEANDTQATAGDGASDDLTALIYRCDGVRLAGEVEVKPHDFRRPPALSQTSQRLVESVHQKFAEHLAARLSTFLRVDCTVTLSKFETPTYRSFIEQLETPAEVALLQIEPLPGVALLHLGFPLCHSIVDRMLGGRGVGAGTDRNLSEIELALLEDAIQVMMDEWCQQWRSERSLRSHCLGHDTNARFLKTSLPDASVLATLLEIQFNQAQGHIHLGVPYALVESLVKEAQLRTPAQRTDGSSKKPQWRSSYNEISVPVVAQWKVGETRLQDIVSLSPGDVLPMDPDLIGRTYVQLADSREFIGSVGIQNGRVAVQLTKHLTLQQS